MNISNPDCLTVSYAFLTWLGWQLDAGILMGVRRFCIMICPETTDLPEVHGAAKQRFRSCCVLVQSRWQWVSWVQFLLQGFFILNTLSGAIQTVQWLGELYADNKSGNTSVNGPLLVLVKHSSGLGKSALFNHSVTTTSISLSMERIPFFFSLNRDVKWVFDTSLLLFTKIILRIRFGSTIIVSNARVTIIDFFIGLSNAKRGNTLIAISEYPRFDL